MMEKDVPGQLVSVVVNYYFMNIYYASSEALDHWRQQNCPKLTSPLMLYSGFKSLLDHPTAPSWFKIFNNKLNKTRILSFLNRARWGSWRAVGYYIV